MHMVSGQDLNAAELETDGHHGKRYVETNEDATVYENDLDLFVTVRPPRRYTASSIAWKTL